MLIRLATPQDMALIATLVSIANQDVAQTFGLTQGNSPKHPSFYTESWVEADLQRGEAYYIAEVDGQASACVAYERPRPGVAYLNRLSVLPAYRKRGIGERLVQHIIELARRESVPTISIGVIGEHLALQGWYRKLGFKEGELKRFSHLPFSVRYMAYAV